MMPNELFIPARYFTQLFDHLESLGMPCRDALNPAQLRNLDDPHGRLTVAQIGALLAEASRLSARQDLGFELGKLIKLNSHDVLGYALISASTLDQLARLAARYYRLMNPLFTMRYERQAMSAEVLFQPVAPLPPELSAFFCELLAVSAHAQLFSTTQGQLGPHDICLSIPTPAHAHRYRELKGARMRFADSGQVGARIIFDAALLDRPLPMADARARQQAEERCKQLMYEVSVQGNWRDWVEMMLRGAEDSQPTLDELAVILNISTRTLDRHLARQGVSFRALALRVRNERACELLSGGSAISQIAYRLGYTDVANFSRSFRKANGVTPSEYRAQQTQAAA